MLFAGSLATAEMTKSKGEVLFREYRLCFTSACYFSTAG